MLPSKIVNPVFAQFVCEYSYFIDKSMNYIKDSADIEKYLMQITCNLFCVIKCIYMSSCASVLVHTTLVNI